MSVDSFVLTISRNTVYSDTEVVFELIAECAVTPDDSATAYRLDQNIFVKNTEDASFLRVANASDLGTLKSDRNASIALSHTEYRDSVATFSFSDVDTAVAAIPVLRDRVNASVHNHLTYLKKFSTDEELPFTYSLPLPSVSQEQRDEYVEAYSNAREARLQSETELSNSQQALDAVSYKLDFVTTIKSTVCNLEDLITPTSTSLANIYTSMVSGNSSTTAALASLNAASEVVDGNSNITGYTITPSAYSQLKNALGAIIDSVVPTVSTASNQLGEARSTLELKCLDLTALETSLVNQSGTLRTNLDDFASESRALSASEASTLRDLSSYCPDVDPSTVP
jgi:hypothetical protein